MNDLKKTVRLFEKRLILRALRNSDLNVSECARKLKMNRTHMHKMLAKHGIRGGGEPPLDRSKVGKMNQANNEALKKFMQHI